MTRELKALAYAKRLKRVLKAMPSDMWIWVGSGTPWLMRKKDGRKVMIPLSGQAGGGVDPDYIVAQLDGEFDGGDW